jgi:hypothetical protein
MRKHCYNRFDQEVAPAQLETNLYFQNLSNNLPCSSRNRQLRERHVEQIKEHDVLENAPLQVMAALLL